MAKKPQPKPPPRAGGGARSAGGGTLAQATGGKPGRVTPAAPVKRSLGLGLGLNPQQRGNFQQAVQSGQGGQFLGNHPGIQKKIGRIDPNSAQGGRQQGRIENFMGTGQSQRMPQPPTTQRQPRGAQQLGPQAQAPLGMPQQGAFQGNFAQGTGDQLTPQGQQQMGLGQQGNGKGPATWAPGQGPNIPGAGQGGWSGDNASMQGQLGQQGGQNYGYANPNYGGQQGGGMAQQGGGGAFGAMRGQFDQMRQQMGNGQSPQQQQMAAQMRGGMMGQQGGPADPYGYGQGGGAYGGVGQGASAGYGGRQQGAGWGYGGQYGGGLQQQGGGGQMGGQFGQMGQVGGQGYTGPAPQQGAGTSPAGWGAMAYAQNLPGAQQQFGGQQGGNQAMSGNAAPGGGYYNPSQTQRNPWAQGGGGSGTQQNYSQGSGSLNQGGYGGGY